MLDENQKLFDEIKRVVKHCKNPNLQDKFYPTLVDLTEKLIAVYHEQNKKITRIEKNNTSFLKQVDRRTVVQHEISTMKDKMLSQQSKMAMMGDMMDSVAHQWKQPLNSLTMLNDMLVDDFKDDSVDEAYIADMTETSHMQIKHMVDTLGEFRTFFRPSKEMADFTIGECIDSVEILIKDELIKNNIVITKDISEEITIHGLLNEFKHVFLNLLSNSKDAFNEKEVQNKEIKISCYKKDSLAIIEFQDNAQGIPNHVIASIFKPNVTTKTDGKGTGIGLYMSSQIVEKHNGTIGVKNNDTGAIFTISIKI